MDHHGLDDASGYMPVSNSVLGLPCPDMSFPVRETHPDHGMLVHRLAATMPVSKPAPGGDVGYSLCHNEVSTPASVAHTPPRHRFATVPVSNAALCTLVYPGGPYPALCTVPYTALGTPVLHRPSRPHRGPAAGSSESPANPDSCRTGSC